MPCGGAALGLCFHENRMLQSGTVRIPGFNRPRGVRQFGLSLDLYSGIKGIAPPAGRPRRSGQRLRRWGGDSQSPDLLEQRGARDAQHPRCVVNAATDPIKRIANMLTLHLLPHLRQG
jgi:hypothetical protein